MKSLGQVMILTLIVMTIPFLSSSQVSAYAFSTSSGTYTALVSPTNVFSGNWDDNTAVTVPIGFTFAFNGANYTTVNVHTNGYVTFGSSTTGYTPLSGGSAAAGIASPYGRDLQGLVTGSIDYKSTGGVFTVQWSDARRYNGASANTESINFQVQLVQTTGAIHFVYGTWSDAGNNSASGDNTNGEVGLRGASGSDYKNIQVLSSGSWSAPSAGSTNSQTAYYNQAITSVKPATGLKYTFTPSSCIAPVDPEFSSETDTICGAQSVELSPSNAGSFDVSDTLYWYLDATGGSAIASGNIFNTPVLSADEDYYVELSNGTCSNSGGRIHKHIHYESACITCPDLVSPEICVVSTLPDNYNKIIWEKPGEDDNVDVYNVYRHFFGEDILVGFVTSADSSFVIDSTVSAAVQAYSYRLETVDTCGTSGWAGGTHTSIHLIAGFGTNGFNNLSWNIYQDGTASFPEPEQFFYIYRGEDPGTMELIDSTSSAPDLSFVTYTDTDPPVGLVYYRVALILEESCDASRDVSGMMIHSNTAGLDLLEGINESAMEHLISVFPNPASQQLQVQLSLPQNFVVPVALYDTMGRLVHSEQAPGQSLMVIHRDGLPAGVYSLVVNVGEQRIAKRIVFQ